jgi:lysophospholipase L1-like esterase
VVPVTGTPALRGVPRYLTFGISALAMALTPWQGQAACAARGGSAAPSAAPEYLALGDSIAYGYDPRVKPPATEASYIGYPTDVGAALSDIVVNASCPGDTSAGFVSADGVDVGCRDVHSYHALHVDYSGTELEFATDFLRSHQNTNLVTVGIGINDVYGCMTRTSDRCASEMASTLGRMRAIYHGPLVLVNYYLQYYKVPSLTRLISPLNAIMAQVAPNYGAIIADEFAAFAARTADSGGDGCRAGLMIETPDGGCDAHLTPAGRSLMAATIVQALKEHTP